MVGCGHIKTNDFLGRTGHTLSKVDEKTPSAHLDEEIESLFDQPYIDPLTAYLHRHADDPARAALLKQVRRERERRCAAVARRYNTDKISETGLALFRRGYSYSCPQHVAAYEAKLDTLKPQAPKTTAPLVGESGGDDGRPPDAEVTELDRHGEQTPAHAADEAQKQAAARQLNDCYLLTRIRNFSDALEACRGPAEAGVAGAQASIAQIQSTLGHHESAYRWARKAATESGQAAFLLGEMYARGLGVAKDMATAAQWFRAALELGHAEAENALHGLNSGTMGANAD
ncbi:hypothetical protein RE428_49180 (plasmid) [Marinobacter nanhaiticus D15-8W]|uniref:Sel1 repeat family protein n=2 Tax=Marinobacter TaxID=2742 RepID=N6WAB7_9GAMM|nr:sel1 repeat family protein [Marinobacter nanhaiticus D15-8W]BES73900.1 hypothetical protein RE428_49180 [Marinobacter nanhaiticus D15-8W]